MPRRRAPAEAHRTYEASERESDGHDEENCSCPVLPRLVCAKPQRRLRGGTEKPQWMVSTRGSGVQALSGRVPRKKVAVKASPPQSLSLLDEQMLVLCRSAIHHSNVLLPPRESPLRIMYGYESIYAATQVQRLFRGFATRKRLAEFHGPRFQRAAGCIQFALRRVLVARRVFKRWMGKRHRCATRIQAWFRGSRCREIVRYERARVLVERITMFQRRFRGYRFWNLVAALLAQRRHHAATQIQRCCRGMAARCRMQQIRHERVRFSVELKTMGNFHRRQARCTGCRSDTWTEDSLFMCFMVRFVGLHDFSGAKVLGLNGVQAFPESARFSFMYSILLQAMGEDLEISMAFLRRAEATLGISEADVLEVERRYLYPALQLSKNDIAVLLDLAIVSQCTDKLTRAAVFYRLALEQPPVDYSVPGYLHRVDMLDRLLLNYHRFCSLFNSRQINVLVKAIPIAKRGERVRVMVTRHGHFTRIQCTEEGGRPRFNSVYLIDEEVALLLAKKVAVDQDGKGSSNLLSRSVVSSASRRNATAYGSTRQSARMLRDEKIAAAQDEEVAARKRTVTLRFQSEFHGLVVKPVRLAAASETRSKLQITRDQAERLLRELLFVDPHAQLTAELNGLEGATPSASAASLHRILLVPSTLKQRMLRMEEVLHSHAIVNIQRAFRGFRVRARMRRESLLRTIRQHQVDQLYARLHQNFQLREKRRLAASAVQRMYKGFATRRLMTKWRVAATTIQRMYRGHQGRKRAVAFREGNLTFHMAERVYQRGISISGKAVLLLIDRCGLSFRLEAYDMVGCTMYPGFISHDSTMALIRYENWSYAQRLIGQDVWFHGNHGIISSVAFMHETDGQCVVACQPDESPQDPRLADLRDCIQAINLRNLGLMGLAADQLVLPLTSDDTCRIVSCIVERLALVPAIPMATKELRRKAPGSLLLALVPPPRVHYVFNKNESIAVEISHSTPAKAHASLPASLARQIAFPVVDGYRGVSIGKPVYRQKCHRHATHFTKCRCVLPLTTTPAYVHAITLALTPPPLPSYHTTFYELL